MSRLSHAQRAQLAREDGPLLSQPLPLGTDPRIMAAHLRRAIQFMGEPDSPSAKTIAYLNALFARSIPPSDNQRLACRAGCAHCCQQAVQVLPAEAFFLAAALQDRPDTIAAIRAAARQVSEAGDKGKFWLTCPMLQDGHCTAYAARPLNCRAFASLNVSDCIRYLSPLGSQTGSAISAPRSYLALRNIVKAMGLTAMRIRGLPGTAYEMNSALCAVFDSDNAEQRWLAGENIFAGAKAYPLSPLAEGEVARMTAYITPTL